MADEKLNTGPEAQKTEEAPAPAVADPAHGEAAVPEHPPEQAGPAEPGDVVISAEQIDALMAEKRQAARAEVEKAEASREQEAGAPAPEHPAVESEKAEKPRRGRPPKSDKTERPGPEAEKEPKKSGPRKGRPSKADKAAPDKAQPSKRDKLSRSGGKAPDVPVSPDAGKDKPAKETAPPEQGVTEPAVPPRPVEEGKLVYLKLSELHPFHTFRPHPFKVRDDAKMQETVASIKLNGVMVPGLARPEKDGNGYEIVAGHRRCRGSELAGLEEMPFIVRDMTDHEAVEAMKDSNKQRDQTLPSELAALLDLEVEDIKHQGSRLKNVAEGDVGKRSVEIVGEAHGMNYKKVMRYLRLNHLVPELMDKVDDKKMGFMPAVELSYRTSLPVKGWYFGDPKKKSLALMGALRGNELQQMYVCAQLIRALAQVEQAGQLSEDCGILVVPCANQFSMNVGRRFWAADNTDINRMFPGYSQGETTQRIAATLFSALQGYQYGVHLTSFYLPGDHLPHVRVMETGYQREEEALAFGLPYVLLRTPQPYDTTTLNYNWQIWDTQAFSLYTTVTDHIDEDAAFLAVEAVLRFLSVKGLSSRHLPTAMHRTSIVHEHNLHNILSSAGGLLLDKRAPGDWVAAGDVLGEIVDPCTCRPLEQLRTDCRGRGFFCHRAQLINGHEVAFRVLPE